MIRRRRDLIGQTITHAELETCTGIAIGSVSHASLLAAAAKGRVLADLRTTAGLMR